MCIKVAIDMRPVWFCVHHRCLGLFTAAFALVQKTFITLQLVIQETPESTSLFLY